MQIPYTEHELLIALLGIDDNKLEEAKLEELMAEFIGKLPEENRDLNKKIAEFHGISVEGLLNSPNYKILCQEYGERVIRQLIKNLQEKFGLTDQQSWALYAKATGLI